MAYDADSLIQLQREARLRQQHAAATRPAHEQVIPKIEMLVGAWDVDQFGNQPREIKSARLGGAAQRQSAVNKQALRWFGDA